MAQFEPASGPRWLTGHPQRLAWWMQRRNLFRRFPLLWLLAALALSAAAWGCTRQPAIGFMQGCLRHRLLLGSLATLCAAVAARRRRRRAERAALHSWLAALPVRRKRVLPLIGPPLKLLLVLAIAGLFATAAGLPLAALRSLLLTLATAALLGTAGGWLLGGRAEAPPLSRQVSASRAAGNRLRATLRPLGTWPVACAQVWGRPSLTGRWLFLLLLAVPLGTPGLAALAGILAVLLVWHLVALLAAVIRVAFPAAWWLAPTSISTAAFTGALVHRAWLRQSFIAALGFSAALALGGLQRRQAVALGAAGWLTLTVVAGTGGCVLARGQHSPATSPLHRWLT